MKKLLLIVVLLLVPTYAYAQFKVRSQADHPYRHKPNDLNSVNRPAADECAVYDGTTGQFRWAACQLCEDSVLLENGDFMLTEDGDHVLLESSECNGSGTTISSDAPANPTDSCTAGAAAYDSSYFYMCVGTDTWERAALSTWTGCNSVATGSGNTILTASGNRLITSNCGCTNNSILTGLGNTLITSSGHTVVGPTSCTGDVVLTGSSNTILTNLGNTLVPQ